MRITKAGIMNYSFIHYLIASSVYSLIFFLIYKWIFSGLTHFNWMRAYILSSLVLSLVLPLVSLPVQWTSIMPGNALLEKSLSVSMPNTNPVFTPTAMDPDFWSGHSLQVPAILALLLTLIYFTGALYKTAVLIRNLLWIRECIRNNPRQKEGNCWIISMSHNAPAFSIFNFIFINYAYKNLTRDEFQQIKDHEHLHAKQFHALDILFIEFISILFWFNPVLKYLKIALQEVHEYLADEYANTTVELRFNYANMLLNLVSEAKTPSLSSGFSGKQISRRILMLTKARSLKRHKLSFVLIIPAATILLLLFSGFDNTATNYPSKEQSQKFPALKESSPRIGRIHWTDNVAFSDDQLNAVLKLQHGDEYSREKLNHRIWIDRDGIATLYFDQGYVFFNSEINELQAGEGVVDLNIKVYEGIRGKIGNIRIKGNRKVSTEDILDKIVIHPGDWFNKTKIIRSVEAIKAMDKFIPEKIIPTPVPVPEQSTAEFAVVILEFQVTEK